MAIGDSAAAAGLAVFAPTQDKRLGYQNDNVRGDELATHMTNGTHPANKITGQFTTAQYADGSVTTIKVADSAITDPKIKAGEVKTRALDSQAVTGPKLADTVTKTGSFILEGSPLSIRGSVAKVTVGVNAAVEGGIISLLGDDSSIVLGLNTVVEAGSSFTVNADGSLFLEPAGYVTSTRTYSNTTTAKPNVYIDGNGRLFRSTTATQLSVDVDYDTVIADLTARIEALEAAATKEA